MLLVSKANIIEDVIWPVLYDRRQIAIHLQIVDIKEIQARFPLNQHESFRAKSSIRVRAVVS